MKKNRVLSVPLTLIDVIILIICSQVCTGQVVNLITGDEVKDNWFEVGYVSVTLHEEVIVSSAGSFENPVVSLRYV